MVWVVFLTGSPVFGPSLQREWGTENAFTWEKESWASHSLSGLWFPFLQNEITSLGDSIAVNFVAMIYLVGG